MNLTGKDRVTGNILLCLAAAFAIAYCVSLQFMTPAFYESDSYYHTAVARQIMNEGPRHDFHWARLSTFNGHFSDKDFLFHLLIVPFLTLTPDIVLAGKLAVILLNASFILAFVFIARRYLPGYLAAFVLLLPFLSSTFTNYMLYLRSFTLAIILTMLAVYLVIRERPRLLFLVSLVFSLSHISFFTVPLFALAAETLRYLYERRFAWKTVTASAAGIALGCLLHPNFPDNLLSMKLHYLIVMNVEKGVDLAFGIENFAFPFRQVLMENFAMFLSGLVLIAGSLAVRRKPAFPTAVWGVCALFYLCLAFPHNRYWYPANALFFLFFASYINDWIGEREWKDVSRAVSVTALSYFAAAALFFNGGTWILLRNMLYNSAFGVHYENMAVWMRRNIPQGEMVYHNYWHESAYLTCYDPGHDYMVVLDPIYMYYRDPRLFRLYYAIMLGRVEPYAPLKRIFKVRYGVALKDEVFYRFIKEDPRHFRILYSDDLGIAFEIL